MRLKGVALGIALVAVLWGACYHPQPIGSLEPPMADQRGEVAASSIVSDRLTAQQAVALALNHPRLEAVALRVDVARAGVDAAGAWPNPELRLTTRRLGEGVGSAVERMDMELRYRPERPGWLDSQRDVARFDVQIRQARAKAQRAAAGRGERPQHLL